MQYEQLLAELRDNADEAYGKFHCRLLKNDSIKVIGVRVPCLRKLAKKHKNEIEELLRFPDEFYEVTFIKLSAVSLLEYDSFINYVDDCVKLIDNWATCDCFAPACIAKHKEQFLPYIEKYSESDGEFYQRFALTTLLHYYVEERYIDMILDYIRRADCEKYYVHMAAAWLLAEVLVKYYDRGVEFLNENVLNKKTHNKAIQKACESFRLSDERKNYIKGLKK